MLSRLLTGWLRHDRKRPSGGRSARNRGWTRFFCQL